MASGNGGSVSGRRCAPPGWRPMLDDEDCRREACRRLGADFAGWLSGASGHPWSAASAADLLFAHARADMNGYALARSLERRLPATPDADLLHLLENWQAVLEESAAERETEEAARLGIETPFKFAAKALYHQEDCDPVSGIAFRADGDEAGLVAFVSDAEAEGVSGEDLVVLMVGLESVEVVGPAPEIAVAIHVSVAAAVRERARRNEERSRIIRADEHASSFDLYVDRTTGGDPDECLRIMEEALEMFRMADASGNERDRWLAGLLCASAARRAALISGAPPERPEELSHFVDRSRFALEMGDTAPADGATLH